MARLEGGIFGNFHGRIGNTVYYVRNGKQVARKLGKIEKPATPAQQTCRQRLKVLSVFFKPVKAFINAGFAKLVAGTAAFPYNAAVKYNLEQATVGAYPDVKLNYAKIVLSKGNLLPASNLLLNKEVDGLRFTWENIGMDYQDRYHGVMILVYFPEGPEALCMLNAGQRQEGTVFLALDALRLQKELHCYLAFISEDRYEVSNSQYVGFMEEIN